MLDELGLEKDEKYFDLTKKLLLKAKRNNFFSENTFDLAVSTKIYHPKKHFFGEGGGDFGRTPPPQSN